jgi:hypothetical protein
MKWSFWSEIEYMKQVAKKRKRRRGQLQYLTVVARKNNVLWSYR